jgi:hypothetical protein
VARERQALGLAEAAYQRGRTMPTNRAEQEAVLKARQLLVRLLTPEQREQFEQTRVVVVRTATASYEIGVGSMVIAHRDGRQFALCIQFAESGVVWLPAEDLMIAKLLLIRTDEEGMWQRFAPPAFRELPDAYIFDRGELPGRTIMAGPPVNFTEDLVPWHPPPLQIGGQ